MALRVLACSKLVLSLLLLPPLRHTQGLAVECSLPLEISSIPPTSSDPLVSWVGPRMEAKNGHAGVYLWSWVVGWGALLGSSGGKLNLVPREPFRSCQGMAARQNSVLP